MPTNLPRHCKWSFPTTLIKLYVPVPCPRGVDHTGHFWHPPPSASPTMIRIMWTLMAKHLFLNIIPSNFTEGTGRKRWCVLRHEWGVGRGGGLIIEGECQNACRRGRERITNNNASLANFGLYMATCIFSKCDMWAHHACSYSGHTTFVQDRLSLLIFILKQPALLFIT